MYLSLISICELRFQLVLQRLMAKKDFKPFIFSSWMKVFCGIPFFFGPNSLFHKVSQQSQIGSHCLRKYKIFNGWNLQIIPKNARFLWNRTWQIIQSKIFVIMECWCAVYFIISSRGHMKTSAFRLFCQEEIEITAHL